ncbi:MAG: NAD-binding protein [Acidimicrobiia bacterium]|nr:NAD-binding protein [Acidimicrobiia bacterium]
MKAIVVGAGGTTRELLRRLGERWDVVVVEADEDRFTQAEGIRDFERVIGDGSSGLVLKRAGLDDADALIAGTHDDDVNLEALRIAKDAGLLRVVGVAADPERLPDYRALEVPVFAPDSMTARNVEVLLEPRRVASTTFAQGKAEAIEFRISPDAPVAGKRLLDLHAETWVIAAVLREGELIVPHGSTRLQPGDSVTVVGAASDFAAIVRTFTAGESRFPLSFGRKVVVGLTSVSDLDDAVSEAMSFVRNTQAEQLVVVYPDPATQRDDAAEEELAPLLEKLQLRTDGLELELRPTSDSIKDTLLQLADQESVGALVVPAPGGGELLGRVRTAKVLNDYGSAGVPLLLSRSRHPYSNILVPARRTTAGELAGRAGIDIAHTSGAGLTGVAVVPPSFVSGSEEALEQARRAAAWLREEAAVQGVHVRRRLGRGNPVRVLEEMAGTASLVVLSLPELPMSPLRPGIVGHVIRRVPASLLLVPVSL